MMKRTPTTGKIQPVVVVVMALLIDKSFGKLSSNNDDGYHQYRSRTKFTMMPSEFISEEIPAELDSDNDAATTPADFVPFGTNGCDAPCDKAQFCGNDNRCHDYSCDEIYEFGHTGFTRYSPDTSEKLHCVTFDDDSSPDDDGDDGSTTGSSDLSFFYDGEDFACDDRRLPYVVRYGCGSSTSSSASCNSDPLSKEGSGSSPTPVVLRANRKCTAQTTQQNYFSCYDIAPETDMDAYFANYIAAVDASNNTTSCASEGDGTSTSPVHSYGGSVLYSAHKDTHWVGKELGNGLPIAEADGVTFNQALASSFVEVHSERFHTLEPEFPNRCADDGGCKGNEVCGRDNKCIVGNSCSFYYSYGLSDIWPGTNSNSADELTCELLDTFNNPNPTDDCDADHPFVFHSTCPARFYETSCAGDFVHEFSPVRHCIAPNQKCTAKVPSSKSTFTCYEFAPSTDWTAYTQPYLEALAGNAHMCGGGDGSATGEDATDDTTSTTGTGIVHIATSGVVADNDCYIPVFETYHDETFDASVVLRNLFHIRIESDSTSSASSTAPTPTPKWTYQWIPFAVCILYLSMY